MGVAIPNLYHGSTFGLNRRSDFYHSPLPARRNTAENRDL